MRKMIAVLSLGLSMTALAACEMYSESVVNDRRMQVREERVVEQIPTTRLNESHISSIAQSYTDSGKGVVDLTVTYDPVSKTNTAMRAGDEAARLARSFRKEGITDVTTSILPVREQGSESVTIVSYSSYQAAAPANCGKIPGFQGPVLEHDPSYKLGCTVESVFADQIADPSDLLGDARISPQSDGRRSTNVIDVYRTGAPNEPLDGVSASDD